MCPNILFFRLDWINTLYGIVGCILVCFLLIYRDEKNTFHWPQARTGNKYAKQRGSATIQKIFIPNAKRKPNNQTNILKI
jgi:hypothetical protein